MRQELVGRDPEIAVLADCLAAAIGGRPQLVMCRGEPGIGKTRLTEELSSSAASAGVAVAWGRGVDAAGAPAYWPWRQALRDVSVGVDVAAIAEEHRLSADLARLAPEVFGGAAERADVGGSAEDRFRQFDAVGRLLRLVTGRQPLVIVLDDAHWADRPSLLLLQQLARMMTDERLLIVVNHRDTEPVPALLVTDLLREPVTRRVELRGLSAPAVGAQLAALVGHQVADVEVARVHALTGGNPFFVAEMGQVLADRPAGASPPIAASVREAIGGRLNRLSAPAGRSLRAASIVGAEFSVPIVAPMVDIPVMACLASR